jgi:hypothetical protein
VQRIGLQKGRGIVTSTRYRLQPSVIHFVCLLWQHNYRLIMFVVCRVMLREQRPAYNLPEAEGLKCCRIRRPEFPISSKPVPRTASDTLIPKPRRCQLIYSGSCLVWFGLVWKESWYQARFYETRWVEDAKHSAFYVSREDDEKRFDGPQTSQTIRCDRNAIYLRMKGEGGRKLQVEATDDSIGASGWWLGL